MCPGLDSLVQGRGYQDGQNMGEEAGKTGFIHPGEEKAKGKPYGYLQLSEKKMQRWRQTLLGCAQRKDKRQ